MFPRVLKNLLKFGFPENTKRRLALNVFRESLSSPMALFFRVNRVNLINFKQAAKLRINCNVCNQNSGVFYDMPNVKRRKLHEIGLLRETLSCTNCGATLRQRVLTYGLLNAIKEISGIRFITLLEYVESDCSLSIFDSDCFSPMHKILHGKLGYVSSKYVPTTKFGAELSKGVFNIDLESIDFPDSKFDIILTSDVMEHVRNDYLAHKEINRCLKNAGMYVFTVPFNINYQYNKNLVCQYGSENLYVEDPHMHGDPLSGGILAYRVYGWNLLTTLSEIGFDTQFNVINSPELGIFMGDLFMASKMHS